MCAHVLTYQDFQTQSKNLDRSLYKLDTHTKKIVSDIKRQLNIKDFNDLKNHEYKPAKMEKPQAALSDLYKFLNKIAEPTYEKLSNQIMEILDRELNDEDETETVNKNKETICKKFFEVICNNSICSNLYAKLFLKITLKHPSFKTLFRVHLNMYLDNFKEIKFVSPNQDYDAYCDYVKENDKK